MTDDHEPNDEPTDEEPITGELVDDEGRAVSPSPRGRIPLLSLVGVACLLLALMGIVLFSLTVPAVLDPEGAQCTFAKRSIDDAGADDEDYNDVVVDGEALDDASDLSCDEAIPLAESIPTSSDGDETVTVPSAGTVRTSSAIAGLLGLLQTVTGVGTLMTASRAFRTAAASAAIVGTIIAIIPILPLVLGIFIVWALLFSGQAKAIWGRVRFLGGSRRSTEE